MNALWFGLAAAPLGWTLQMWMSASLAGYACYPHADPVGKPLWTWLPAVLPAISAAAFAIALSGGAVAWNTWQHTRSERPGSAHQLMETGDGRTRFIAMFGLLTSTVFVIAVAFGATALWLVPLWGR
jgi:hypothetical protein